MATRNSITGDRMVSKTTSEEYRNNWNKIFGKKEEEDKDEEDNPLTSDEEEE